MGDSKHSFCADLDVFQFLENIFVLIDLLCTQLHPHEWWGWQKDFLCNSGHFIQSWQKLF